MNKNNLDKIKTTLLQKTTLAMLGFLLLFIMLESGLRAAGFILLIRQENFNRVSLQKKDTYRIMCIGESTTAFYRVSRPYPLQLEEILNNSNAKIAFSVINKGTVAANSSDLVSRLESDLDIYKPDMVVAMMGINDCGYFAYESLPSSKLEVFLSKFKTYKLLRLIWTQTLNKLKETKIPRIQADRRRGYGLLQSIFLSFNLRVCFAESDTGKGDIPGERNKFKSEAQIYIKSGEAYREKGQYLLAEESFKKALESDEENIEAYLKLGSLYQEQGNYAEAEESFKKVIGFNPKAAEAYLGLAWASREQGKYIQAEEAFNKAIGLNPDGYAYFSVGYFYRENLHNLDLAEKAFAKAVVLNQGDYMSYRELGKTYILMGKYLLAENLFNEFRKKYPHNYRIYQDIIQLYEAMNEKEYSPAYSKKLAELRSDCFWCVTAANYIKLKKILDARGIKLVCVQYPMRDVGLLKEVFSNDNEITFVDNEKIFKDTINVANYKQYFVDDMFGDFGHCTNKGNRLLAENIARVILKEVFHK